MASMGSKWTSFGVIVQIIPLNHGVNAILPISYAFLGAKEIFTLLPLQNMGELADPCLS